MTATTAQLQARETARAVMSAAWATYRAAYPFDGFNRARFGRVLKACWRDAREPITAPATRRDAIQREIALLPYRESFIEAQHVRERLTAELAAL